MMKWLGVCALLLSVLAAMRVGSWAAGWILARLAPLRIKLVAIVANLLAFGVFVFLLVRDLLPGEPLDMTAVVFGLAVFTVCCWTDLHWRPWRPRNRRASTANTQKSQD